MTRSQKHKNAFLIPWPFIMVIGLCMIGFAVRNRKEASFVPHGIARKEIAALSHVERASAAWIGIIATHPDRKAMEWLVMQKQKKQIRFGMFEETFTNHHSASVSTSKNEDGSDCILLNWSPAHLMNPAVPLSDKYMALTHEIVHLRQVLSGRYPRYIAESRQKLPAEMAIQQESEIEAYRAECDLAQAYNLKPVPEYCTQYYAVGPSAIAAKVTARHN